MSKHVTIYYVKRSHYTIYDSIHVKVRDTDKGYLIYNKPKLSDWQVGCKSPVEAYLSYYAYDTHGVLRHCVMTSQW